MPTVTLPTWYYRQFDADYNLDVPAEAYGGWAQTELEMNTASTALVIMHAWDCGTYEKYPGWWRAIEYIPRSLAICRDILPGLAAVTRQAGMRVIHVAGGKGYFEDLPAYRETLAITDKMLPERPPLPPWVEADETVRKLREFKKQNCLPGTQNIKDIENGMAKMAFAPGAEPAPADCIVKDTDQLLALCLHYGIKHLVYAGFAINWCLLLMSGGMHDMHGRGILCSAIREAVTAVENKETARGELSKENGLWRVAVQFGFVYDIDDFVNAISK